MTREQEIEFLDQAISTGRCPDDILDIPHPYILRIEDALRCSDKLAKTKIRKILKELFPQIEKTPDLNKEAKHYWKEHFKGKPSLENLFNLKRDDLLSLLRSVLHSDEYALSILDEEATVTKTTINDIPVGITIESFNELFIDCHGIRTYRRKLIKFTN